MDLHTIKVRLQEHLSDGLVTIVGSGLSCAEGLPSMGALATYLQQQVGGTLTGDDATTWATASALFTTKGLEGALLAVPPTPTVELAIATATGKLIAESERTVVSEVFAGTRKLRLTRLLPHLVKTPAGLVIVTTNYDRLVEIAAEEADIGADTMFVGRFAGKLNESESRMSFCRGVAMKLRRSASLQFRHRVIVFKPHGSLDWYARNGQPVFFAGELPDVARMIITPGHNKFRNGYESPFDIHRSRANEAIDRARRFLVLGYGFNDDHLETHLSPCIKGGKAPAPCLLLGNDGKAEQVLFGLVSSRSPITTLDSRIKVTRSVVVAPSSMAGLLALICDAPHAKNFSSRVKDEKTASLLSPKLSSYLIQRLATISSNNGSLRAVAEKLSVPKRFKGNSAMQEDAVQTALAAFGLGSSDQATSVELAEGRSTALGRVAIMEDSVVEHDARSVPGYSLIQSDVTGRALFKKGEDQLEVFTANRRELEHCFGVDLIYVNLTKQNVVMLQYKMLEPSSKSDDQPDWVYRPDGQLDAEIARMNAFAAAHPPGPKEYRLNPQVFYMKFVKRDASIGDGGIITPLDHFEKLRADPSFKGPKKGLRLSFKSLSGRYLRQTPFLDLVKCGYIGAHAQTTADLQVLIEAILDGNKAVVAAVQQKVSE